MDNKPTNENMGPALSGSYPTKSVFDRTKNVAKTVAGRQSTQLQLHAQRVVTLLEPFLEIEPLRQRVAFVLNELPQAIQADFLDDPHFRISLDDCEPGKGRTVLMPSLNPNGSESRCVVLKPKLAACDESFSLYIIAHELAHAFLRNGGWGEIEDREDAADALAANWGFPRPQQPFSLWSIVSRSN